MEYDRELRAALEIARDASTVARDYFEPGKMAARAKGDRDVVTAADYAAEALVAGRLRETFPEDGVVGEEGTDTDARSTRQWCIDPVDGTLNFSRYLPIWCVSLALFEHGIPVVGVIVDPLRNEVFAAASGAGATLNGTRIITSGRAELSESLVHMTIDFEEQSMRHGLDDIQVLAPRVLRTRNIGSAALALAYVAAGRFDVMIHRFAHAWDYGAGAVIVQEAGGSITALDGSQYTMDTVAVVASSTSELGDSVRAALRNEAVGSLE